MRTIWELSDNYLQAVLYPLDDKKDWYYNVTVYKSMGFDKNWSPAEVSWASYGGVPLSIAEAMWKAIAKATQVGKMLDKGIITYRVTINTGTKTVSFKKSAPNREILSEYFKRLIEQKVVQDVVTIEEVVDA